MPDFIHAVLNKIDHNRYLFGAFIAVVVMLGFAFGCQPKAASPFTGELVTDTQLQAQVSAYQAELDAKVKAAELTFQQTLAQLEAEATGGQVKAQAALQEIEQRKQAIRMGLESLTSLASAAAGPQFAPLIASAAGISGVLLGLGAKADSARKDQVILSIKGQTATT